MNQPLLLTLQNSECTKVSKRSLRRKVEFYHNRLSEKMSSDKQYVPPPLESDPHPYFPHLIANGAFSPSGTFNDVYMGPLFSQSTNQRTPSKLQDNMFHYQDVVNWENIKLPEKIDLIEITSKDLSPASYCSNIESLIADSGMHFNKYDQSWYGNTQNYGCNQQKTEFPPCAQMNKFNTESTTFCTIQKPNESLQNLKSCAYYNSENTFPENSSYVANYSNLFEKSYTEDPNFYPALNYAPIIPPIDHQAELSNDESDIVVEDSEDEQTDFSEDQEKSSHIQTNQCLVCNTSYTPMGVQFYFLTSQNPLTMSTQVPVISKILRILGKIYGKKNYLCSNCLGLVNTIDHLQQKLEAFTKDLIQKFKNSCFDNKIQFKEKIGPRFHRYRCKKCKKILCLRTFCENHIKKHKSRGFLCELCGKIFRSFKKFRFHLKTHQNKNVTLMMSNFKCSNLNCDKTFKTKSHLKEHENFCLGMLPFKCKKCCKKFPSSTKLKNHVKLKHDKKFVAICSICNIGFTKVSDYKSHMISHSTAKKFSCKKCDKSYKTLSNLNFHMKIHDTKLPFQCEICQKGFMRKEYLETHVNNHKNVKNFACPSCDKKFASQKNLDAHLKNHESNKKNTCNICHKIISSDFEEHLRVHSNLREFECEMCEMRFNTKNTLSKHKKRKHCES